MPLHPQLQALENEFQAAAARAAQLTQSRDEGELTAAPPGGGWSPAQCIEHLNLTARAFLPRIDAALEECRASGGRAPKNFRLGPFAWLFCKVLEPPVRIRARTPKPFEPGRTGAEVVGDFVELQRQLIDRVKASEGLAVHKVRIQSAFSNRVRYPLYDGLKILAAHQRRHLWQAEEAGRKASASAAVALLVAALALGGCVRADQPAPPTDATDTEAVPAPAVDRWGIVPGERLGALELDASEEDLRAAYGAENVQSARIEMGEGATAHGTVLFADDPRKRVEILWADADRKLGLHRAFLRGEASDWKLPNDVTLGTSLKELQRLNGRAFELAGFGWDYSGAVYGWKGGALALPLDDSILYLQPDAAQRESAAYRQVLGDGRFPSDHASMQELNPKVYKILVEFLEGP